MTRREEILVEMLRHFNECEDPARLNGEPGSGDRTPLMAPEWNRSYRELERCIRLMRDEVPWLWWDVRERFLACEVRTIEVRVKNGKPRLPAHCEVAAGAVEVGAKSVRVRVRAWSPLVRPERVEAGVRWLSGRFRGEPFLPKELTEAA